MKLSSAAITVAAISLLSTTHAAPLAFKNGEITGRLHHRRGSDLSELSETTSSTRAEEALEALDTAFEPGHGLILPRIVNFLKRQVSTSAAITSSGSTGGTTTNYGNTHTGTTDTDLHTTIMSPDLEEYGFSTDSGPGSALAPVRGIKE